MEFIAQGDLKITLREKSKSYRVLIKDISHIQSESYLSTIYFINDTKPIIVAKLLKKFEQELSKYGFLRICRNVLVNKVNVQVIHNNNSRKISMVKNVELIISCRNYARINQILKK